MKPKLTEEMVGEAIGLIRDGASNADVIRWLGVSEAAFYAWLKNPRTRAQKELAEGLKNAEVERKRWHLRRIREASERGQWQASAWYLERRYPKEYARPEVQLARESATEAAQLALERFAEVTVKIREAAGGDSAHPQAG